MEHTRPALRWSAAVKNRQKSLKFADKTSASQPVIHPAMPRACQSRSERKGNLYLSDDDVTRNDLLQSPVSFCPTSTMLADFSDSSWKKLNQREWKGTFRSSWLSPRCSLGRMLILKNFTASVSSPFCFNNGLMTISNQYRDFLCF